MSGTYSHDSLRGMMDSLDNFTRLTVTYASANNYSAANTMDILAERTRHNIQERMRSAGQTEVFI